MFPICSLNFEKRSRINKSYFTAIALIILLWLLITFIIEASSCSPSHGSVVIAILAEVFFSRDSSSDGDHQIHRFGKVHNGIQSYVHGNNKPSDTFNANGLDLSQDNTVELQMAGDGDNYRPHYGQWYSSIIIPLDEDNKIYYSNSGSSGSSGWLYIKVRGYYI